jgi:hypothetical protein
MSVISKVLNNTERVERNPYDFVDEAKEGFAITQKLVKPGGISLFVFRWEAIIRVGEVMQRDRCNKLEIGAVQNVVNFRAIAKWRSGTTWVWHIPGLPLRDVLGQASPFFNRDFRFRAPCGETVRPELGDSPRLLREPGQPMGYKPKAGDPEAIPWDDPLTGEPATIQTLDWDIDFNSFMIQLDPTAKTFKKILSVAWGVRLGVTFDTKQPVGKRGTLVRSDVPIVRGTTTSPIISGPIAKAMLRLDQARTPTEAARFK